MYSIVILAAGLGRRMQGADKMLLPLNAKPLVRHVVDAALAASLRPVIVVMGDSSAQMSLALSGADVDLIRNHDPERGLSSSLAVGIAAVPQRSEGALVMLGDMPGVRPSLIERLSTAAQANVESVAVIPCYRGQRGNPVLIKRTLFASIGKLCGDQGAKQLFKGRNILELDVDERAIIEDIDTPSDYIKACSLHTA